MGNINVEAIFDNYRVLLLDDETISNFMGDIFDRIDKYRIKVTESDDETTHKNPYNPVIHESFCHAFYRILGLPVVSPLLKDFYNPGYFAPDLNDYKKSRANIDNNQGNLYNLEKQRELICSSNMSLFLSKSEEALKYKVAILQYPRKINILKELPDQNCYVEDLQIETITDRPDKYKQVTHILRPFRCNAYIAPVDRVFVPSKNLAAPFYYSTLDPQIETFDPTYLETVCKIRFSTTAMTGSVQIDSLELLKKALKSIQTSGLNIFSNILENQSVIETYTLTTLMNGFINACIEYAEKIKEYKNLAARYNAIEEQNSVLATEIEWLEESKIWYESIQAFIPTNLNVLTANNVQTSNIDNGVLTAPLMNLLNSPVNKLNKMLAEKNDKKKKHSSEINNLSSNMFYTSGEVHGIGTLEMIAMMISFWSLSQESLLSMLDAPAFNRLYENNPTLRNKTVLERNKKSDKAPHKNIIEVMSEFDSNVYNLLSLADSIIEYCL